ncbi:MAG: type II secretion system protein N [Gammaproteobacteria bacterium]
MYSPLLDRIVQLGPLALAITLLVVTVLSHLPFFSGPPAAAAVNAGRAQSVASHGTPGADFSEMPGWHLFGMETADEPSGESKTPASAITAELPPATVDLRLNGIAFATDSSRAYAIIATADGIQKKYRSGEAVTPEVTIHAIDRQQVVIAYQGRLEALRLPVDSLPRDPSLAAPPARAENPYLSQMRLIQPARAVPRPPDALPALQIPVPPPNAREAAEANQ